MTITSDSLADAFTRVLAGACAANRVVTFLHVPKCFGTAVTAHARRLFPDIRLDGGHRALLEGRAPAADPLVLSSIRSPAARFKSIVLHALRDNRPDGFCAADKFPVLSGFLRRPTAAGLRSYLVEEYWHASYFFWFRMFLGDTPLDRLRACAADPAAGTPTADEQRLVEGCADAVTGSLAVCLYDDPDFMRWMPPANAASQFSRLWQRRRTQRVTAIIAEVIAEKPGVLLWEQLFYDRCVTRQRERLEAGATPPLRRCA